MSAQTECERCSAVRRALNEIADHDSREGRIARETFISLDCAHGRHAYALEQMNSALLDLRDGCTGNAAITLFVAIGKMRGAAG